MMIHTSSTRVGKADNARSGHILEFQIPNGVMPEGV
jgi:hypothetical protein